MSGLEITALSVIGVVGYVAGMGITWRLMGGDPAPDIWTEPVRCGCKYERSYGGSWWRRCEKHRNRPLRTACALWPLTVVAWLGWRVVLPSLVAALYLPLAATFRTCAGIKR